LGPADYPESLKRVRLIASMDSYYTSRTAVLQARRTLNVVNGGLLDVTVCEQTGSLEGSRGCSGGRWKG
jgi:hypothetical protein